MKPIEIMQEKIVKFIDQKNDHVSYAEFRKIEGSAGKFAIEHGNTNIISAFDFSKIFIAAIRDLKDKKIVKWELSSVFTYLIDGETITLPIAKKFRKYKKLHWYPIVTCKDVNFDKELAKYKK